MTARRRRATGRGPGRALVAAALFAAASSVAAHGLTARAALPPLTGGRLRVPTPGPLAAPSPTGARTPLEIAIASATHPRLYRLDPSGGEPVPVIAAGQPVPSEGRVVVPLAAADPRAEDPTALGRVLREGLLRALEDPRARWLLPDVAPADVALVSTDQGEGGGIRLAASAPDLAFRLAAHRLALPADGDVAQGPFRAAWGRQRITLAAFASSAAGAPWLDRIEVLRPPTRAAALRAFELRRLDASWDGPALYGDDPGFPVRAIDPPATAAVLLVRNGARLEDGAWCAVGAALDRARLAPAGLVPDDRLAFGAAGARVGPDCDGVRDARPPATLKLLVRRDDRWDARLAESLAGVLDGAGTRLVVVAAADPSDRTDWDARVVTVTPTLPSLGALVGEALVEAGRPARAAALVRAGGLRDADVARRFARGLDALSLGRRRERLTIRADVGEVPHDPSGVPLLADVAYGRPAPPPLPAP